MKNVIFNILTVIMLLATVGVGAVYAAVLFSGGGPDLSALSSIAAAPGPEVPTALILPTITETPRKMAPTWTETPNTLATYDYTKRILTQTANPANGGKGIGGVIATSTLYSIPTYTTIPSITPSPTWTTTPVTPTLTYTLTYTPWPTNTPWPTSTPIPTNTPFPGNFLTATAQKVNWQMTQDALSIQNTQIAITQIYVTQTQGAIFTTQTASAVSSQQTATSVALTATAAYLPTSQTMTASAIPWSTAQALTAQAMAPNPSPIIESVYYDKQGSTANSGDCENTTPDFNFQWKNPDGVISFNYYWGPNASGIFPVTNVVANVSGNTSTGTLSVPGGNHDGLRYYFRVGNVFSATLERNLSNGFTVCYDNVGPSNPSGANSNASGVSNNSWTNSAALPNFSVNGSSDGGSGLAGYHFAWVNNTSETATPPAPVSSPAPPPSSSFSVGSLPDDGIYELWAQPEDKLGNLNGSMTKVFIYKLDRTAPSNPTPLSIVPDLAYNGGSATNYKATTPEFSWPVSTDNLSGLLNYQYYWNDSPPASNDTITSTTPSTSFKPPVAMTVCNLYYFRVRAVDAANNTSAWVTQNLITRDASCP